MAQKPVSEMSTEEKAAAWDDFMQKRAGRQVKTSARRKAVKSLVEAHKQEYNKLLTQYGGKPTTPKA